MNLQQMIAVYGLRGTAAIACSLPDDSFLKREINEGWTLSDFLLAEIGDAARIANWQRTKDAEKGRNPPKPRARPGVEDPNERRFGNAQMSLTEAKDWWARRRGRK